MKRTYECMLLLDNREVRNGWEGLKGHVAEVLGKHGVEVKSARRWDERRLAYPVRRQHRATYLLVYAEAESENLTALRRDLQFDEKVLRSLILTCDEIPPEAFAPEAAFDPGQVQVEEDALPPAPEAPSEKEATVDEGGGKKRKGGDDGAGGEKPAEPATTTATADEGSDDQPKEER